MLYISSNHKERGCRCTMPKTHSENHSLTLLRKSVSKCKMVFKLMKFVWNTESHSSAELQQLVFADFMEEIKVKMFACTKQYTNLLICRAMNYNENQLRSVSALIWRPGKTCCIDSRNYYQFIILYYVLSNSTAITKQRMEFLANHDRGYTGLF